MKRTINSTGRKTIPLESIAIRLSQSNRRTSFTAAIDIPKQWGFPSSSHVYVEAYVKSTSQRYDFGTVSDPRRPVSTELTEVDVDGAVLFRVKIVDNTMAMGRILASATGIRPLSDADGDDRRPLLPVQERNIGELLWQLELQEGSGPVLVVNNRIPDIAGRLKSDPLLRAAVLPEVLRQSIMHAFSAGNEGDEWAEDWKSFASSMLGRPADERSLANAPELDEEGEMEIFTIVSRFCSQQSFLAALLTQGAPDA